MKKADMIFFIIILVLGIAGSSIILGTMRPASFVVVEVDGEVQGRYELEKDAIVSIVTKDGGENILEICEGKARVRLSNCPNQDCVIHKEISLSNEMIICLPHKVVISVIDDTPGSTADSHSY